MRPRLLATFALALLLCLPTSPAGAEELTAQKRADILALLRESGSDKVAVALGASMARQITESVKAARPDVPVRALEVMEREVVLLVVEKMDGPGGVMVRMVPAYAEAFTHDEIRQILGFYQSPVGLKAVRVMPQLMAQGQRIGQELSQELGPEMRARLKAALEREGIDMKGKSGQVLEQMPSQGRVSKL